MEKLSNKKRLTIVRLYLSGLSFAEISGKTGTSKGSVENVITELKAGVFPEAADVIDLINLMRELSLDLKKSNLNPMQCAIGLAVLTKLNEWGLNPGDMDRWPRILKSLKTEDQAQEFVGSIYNIMEVMQKTGLTLPALEKKVNELEKKAHELEPISAKIDERKKQLADLDKQHKELSTPVGVLEDKMKWLIPRVQELEKREENLLKNSETLEVKVQVAKITIATMNDEIKKLQKIGLSLKTLPVFNQKVQAVAKRHGIEPVKVRDRLLHELKCLDKGLGLETLVENRQQQRKQIEQIIAKLNSEKDSLQIAVTDIQKEKNNLEVSIKTTRDAVCQEIAKITPTAASAVKQLVQELQTGRSEVLAQVRQISDESLEVGKGIGQYQATLQVNQWLNELLALIRGENVPPRRAKVISLSVVRGIGEWLKHQDSKSTVIMSLSINTEKLINELERWEV